MKLLHLLSALLPATGALAQSQQVISIDDQHIQMGRQGAIYAMGPSKTLLLDATKYEFKVPTQLQGRPLNSVQVVLARDRQYSATWPENSKSLLLSASSLKANPGSLPFDGFRSGQQVVVAIGNMAGSEFNVVWVGMVKVN